jgi:SAM-dependent methyltransferase
MKLGCGPALSVGLGTGIPLFGITRDCMITPKLLTERITAQDAWNEVAEALEAGVPGNVLSQTFDDDIVYRAFTEGSIKSEKLREKLHRHPFPDIGKLGIYSDYNLEYHVGGGLTNAMQISSKAEQHHHSIRSAGSVLDFGCGTSRILRYFVEFLPGPRYYASEVFLENVHWGQLAFPEVTYLHQNSFPPIEMKDEHFDIIYAYSIFTHLEEKFHLLWLSELHRLLKPGGLLILTVHGERVLSRCKQEDNVRRSMLFEGKDHREVVSKFANEGYVFYTGYEPGYLTQGGLDAERFGIAYISKKYIRRNWTKWFDVLEHEEGAVSNWQDYVVLEKGARPGLAKCFGRIFFQKG